MYFASLRTEEQHAISFHIVYLDPKDPDPTPPSRPPADRWSYVPLDQRVRLNVSNVVKLAQATDPRTSSLAVFPDARGAIFVSGLVDQGNRYHDFVHYESDAGPGRPGVFQASIAGLGHLVVYDEYDTIGELKVDTLVRLPTDVFTSGAIVDALELGLDDFADAVREEADLGDDFIDSFTSLSGFTQDKWTSALCRLLLRVQRYHHGGAVLLTPDDHLRALNPKYSLSYQRLRQALIHQAAATLQEWEASNESIALADEGDEELPMELHWRTEVAHSRANDARSEVEGALWFISLLTRVDGLVLINPYLDVLGFGVEITETADPPQLWLSQSPSAAKSRRRKGDYAHYGTRHRSMMRYCAAVPGSVGFVVSQDGDVRAITCVDGDLIMWENIKLRLQDFGVEAGDDDARDETGESETAKE